MIKKGLKAVFYSLIIILIEWYLGTYLQFYFTYLKYFFKGLGTKNLAKALTKNN